MWRNLILLLVLGVIVLSVDTALGCPTCKQAFSENGNQEGMVQGYFLSILFMMSMPFTILGGLSLYFYLLVRSANAAKAREAATQGAVDSPVQLNTN